MKFIIPILLLVCFLVIILCFVIIQRNNQVLNYRMRILLKSLELYNKLPTYNEMLYSIKPLKDEYWINFDIQK